MLPALVKLPRASACLCRNPCLQAQSTTSVKSAPCMQAWEEDFEAWP